MLELCGQAFRTVAESMTERRDGLKLQRSEINPPSKAQSNTVIVSPHAITSLRSEDGLEDLPGSISKIAASDFIAAAKDLQSVDSKKVETLSEALLSGSMNGQGARHYTVISGESGFAVNNRNSTEHNGTNGLRFEESREAKVGSGTKTNVGEAFWQPDGNSQESTGTILASDVEPSTDLSLKFRKDWHVRANPALLRSTNPIRKITDSLVLNDRNGKELISFAQGDPAQFGPHMKVPEIANLALIDVVRDGKSNGYALSSGLLECRRAVADYLSAGQNHKYTPQDVTLTSGCSQAIQHSIDILRFDGCNVLMPRPGFPLYETVCKYFGVECRHYDLLEGRGWEVDLHHVAELADDNTAAMIICNPGNPCGTVYDYDQLHQITTLAETLKVPIIADEVYASLAFSDDGFVPMAEFSSRGPVLTVGGISKNWLAPGWRLGWLAISDPHSILRKARVVEALTKIMQITLGPSTLMQAALPKLLQCTPARFFETTRNSLKLGAEICLARIEKIAGLDCPTRPQGSMFMMLRMDPSIFKELRNDVEFSATLLREESVLVLPGSAFGRPNWLRIVFALSLAQLEEAWDRVEMFCLRHARQKS